MVNINRLQKHGLFYYRKNDNSKAKRLLEQLLKEEPDNQTALLFLSKISLEERDLFLGEMGLGEQSFITAINYLSKNKIKSISELASIHSSLGAINPTNVEVLNELGLALENLSYEVHKKTKLLRLGHKYRDKHGNSASLNDDSYISRFFDYENDIVYNLYMQAGKLWEKALELEPENITTLTNLAFWYHKWASIFNNPIPSFVKTLWEKILSMDSSNVLASYKINDCSAEAKRVGETEGCLFIKGLNTLVPPEKDIYKNNSSHGFMSGELTEYLCTGDLINLIKKLESLEGKNPATKIVLYKLYLQRGKDFKAKKVLKEAISDVLEEKRGGDKWGFNSTYHSLDKKSKSEVDYYTTRHDMFKYALPFGHFIFKKLKDTVAFKREKGAIDYFRKINNEYDLGMNLPKIILSTKFKDYWCLVTENKKTSRPRDDALEEFNFLEKSNHFNKEEQKYNLLTKIVKEIAKIHAWFPDEKSGLIDIVHTKDKEKNKKYYKNKVETKLFLLVDLESKRKERLNNLECKIDSLLNKINNAEERKAEEEIKINKLYNLKRQLNINIKLNISKQDFFENFSVILEIISNLEPGAYKDSMFKNFLAINYDNVGVIDFETLRNSPYQIDLATAFEFGNFISNNDSEWNSRRNLLKLYTFEFNEQIEKYNLPKKRIEDFEKFEKEYYACAVQRALVHYGSFSSLGYDDNECGKLIDKAIWNINKLKSYYIKTSQEYEKLDRLENQLIPFSSLGLLGVEKELSKLEEDISPKSNELGFLPDFID